MTWRENLRTDPELATGWIIAAVIVLVLLVVLGLTVWATGSWVVGLVVTVVVGVGLALCM